MTHARIAPGCRRLTPAHVQVQAIAEDFQGLPEGVSKGQALAAFKQAASAPWPAHGSQMIPDSRTVLQPRELVHSDVRLQPDPRRVSRRWLFRR